MCVCVCVHACVCVSASKYGPFVKSSGGFRCCAVVTAVFLYWYDHGCRQPDPKQEDKYIQYRVCISKWTVYKYMYILKQKS